MLALSACDRGPPAANAPTAQTQPVEQATPPPSPAEQAEPTIRVEESSGTGWVFRAEYPAALERHPALLAAIRERNTAALEELRSIAEQYAADPPPPLPPADVADAAAETGPAELEQPPWETRMVWSLPVDGATLTTALLDGYTYTGGAHGIPLIEAIHTDPRSGTLLDPAELVADASGWSRISTLVRTRLREAVEARNAASSEQERSDLLASASTWIDEGTVPDAEHLGLFVPIADNDGRVTAIRWLFPPYQVGPYSDGMQEVEVPIDEIRSAISPTWTGALGLAPTS
jgi:hypothetical protein